MLEAGPWGGGGVGEGWGVDQFFLNGYFSHRYYSHRTKFYEQVTTSQKLNEHRPTCRTAKTKRLLFQLSSASDTPLFCIILFCSCQRKHGNIKMFKSKYQCNMEPTIQALISRVMILKKSQFLTCNYPSLRSSSLSSLDQSLKHGGAVVAQSKNPGR